MQSPREHASCGQPLENSGFSYSPSIFMEHDSEYEFIILHFVFNTRVGLKCDRGSIRLEHN